MRMKYIKLLLGFNRLSFRTDIDKLDKQDGVKNYNSSGAQPSGTSRLSFETAEREHI